MYRGSFVEGRKQGYGRLERINEQNGEAIFYYAGDFEKDMKEGYGEQKWISGNLY